MINSAIGNRLRRARLLREWSQVQLAGAVNVSYQQIQKYESGKDNIRQPMLIKLAGVLGVSVGFFFASPAPQAGDMPPARYIRMMQAMQLLERTKPAAYERVCNLVAALVMQQDGESADLP
jgi:transcriptional regulator with XRE-family HTH domain